MISTLSAVSTSSLSVDHHRLSNNDIFASGGTGLLYYQINMDGNHVRVAKKPHQYDPTANQLAMLTEIKVYERLKDHPHPFILTMLGASPSWFTLYLPFMPNGDLHQYLKKHTSSITSVQRLKWCIQAASAVAHIHHLGIWHCDLNLGNFLLDHEQCLKLCDFAGSSMGDEGPQAVPGDRWVPGSFSFNQAWNEESLTRLDIFMLAVGFYLIQTGSEPFPDYDSDTVKKLYQNFIFPDVASVPMGNLMKACWHGEVTNMDEVVFRTIANIPLPL